MRNLKMFAARRLARAAARPALALSFAALFGSAPDLDVSAASLAREQLPSEDFATHLRNVKQESEARKEALAAALDADLLSLLRAHATVPVVKAKLLAAAAKFDTQARTVSAEVLVPLADLLCPKYAELYELLPKGSIPGTDARQQQLFDLNGWLVARPAPLRLFEAELEKELNCKGATVKAGINYFSESLDITVSVDLGK